MSAEEVRRRPMLSADVATAYRDARPNDAISPKRIDRLAQAGRLPVAGHDRIGRRLYSDRAVTALIQLRDRD